MSITLGKNYHLAFSRRASSGYRSAFTIVELLIVIVVIGILAAISTVAYGGVSTKATEAALKSDLNNAAKQLSLAYIEGGGYPASLPSQITATSGSSFHYSQSAGGSGYCLTAVAERSGVRSFHISSDSSIAEDVCSNQSAVTVNAVSLVGYNSSTSLSVDVPAGSAVLVIVTAPENRLPTGVRLGDRSTSHLFSSSAGTGGVAQGVAYFWLASPPAGSQTLVLEGTEGSDHRLVALVGIDNAHATAPLRGSAATGPAMSPTSQTSSSLSPNYQEGDLIISTAARRSNSVSSLASSFPYQDIIVGPRSAGSQMHSMMTVSSNQNPIGIDGFARYSSHVAISLRHYGR